jgi:hypothetical protein
LCEHRFELLLVAGVAHDVGRDDEPPGVIAFDYDLGVVALEEAFDRGGQGALRVAEVDLLVRGIQGGRGAAAATAGQRRVGWFGLLGGFEFFDLGA